MILNLHNILQQTFSVKDKTISSEEEKVPLNEHEDMRLPHRSLVVTSDGQGSTVSDDGNPTPTSGHDDGYHTEGKLVFH